VMIAHHQADHNQIISKGQQQERRIHHAHHERPQIIQSENYVEQQPKRVIQIVTFTNEMFL